MDRIQIKYPRFARFLIDRFGAVVKKGEEFNFNCPRCGDTKRHFSFNLRYGISNCFRCGYRPDPFEFLRENTDLTLREIRELLYEEGDVEIECKFDDESFWVYEKGVDYPEGSYDPFKPPAKIVFETWCKVHNIDLKDAQLLGLKLIDKDSLRVVIPCWDFTRSKMIYWMARSIFDKEPRYLYPQGIPRSAVFWGLDWLEVYGEERWAFICEGWKDAYRMKGLAVLGAYLTKAQLQVLKQVRDYYRVGAWVVLFDMDAYHRAWEAAKTLAKVELGKVYIAFLKKYKDPGEARNRTEVLKSTEIVEFYDGKMYKNVADIVKKMYTF